MLRRSGLQPRMSSWTTWASGALPGVDQEEAVVGREGRHVGEGRAEADAVGDLDEAADVVDGVEGGSGELAVPEAVGDTQDVGGHGPTLGVSLSRAGGWGRARWVSCRGTSPRTGPACPTAADMSLGRAPRLALLHSLLELGLGRAKIAGQLGDGCSAEEEHDEDDGHDEQVWTENVSEHAGSPSPRSTWR